MFHVWSFNAEIRLSVLDASIDGLFKIGDLPSIISEMTALKVKSPGFLRRRMSRWLRGQALLQTMKPAISLLIEIHMSANKLSVWFDNQKFDLSETNWITSGGEADIYRIKNRAFKIFNNTNDRFLKERVAFSQNGTALI